MPAGLLLLAFLPGCALPTEESSLTTAVEEPARVANLADLLAEYQTYLIGEFRDDLVGLEDAPRYDIEIRISDDIDDISGLMEVEYTNRQGEALQEVYFRLFPNMSGDYLRVDNVQVNGEAAFSEAPYLNTALRVRLDDALQPGESVIISMSFSQQVPSEMGGNYGLYIYQEDILALDSFFPIIPVRDRYGWHVQDPQPNADMIFTEAAFFKVRVSAPSELVLVASGIEVNQMEEDGRRISEFVGGPQRDFYIAASPRFSSQSMQVGGTILTSYFPEEYRETGEKVLMSAAQAFIIFSESYGSYPYTELDLVSTPMQAGGMEYSGVAALALNQYRPEPPQSDMPGTVFLESATAHEVAHQWFFNQVMNDPLQEPWLDEGLAQYLTYIYYRDYYGAEAGQRYIDSWQARWMRVDYAQIPIGLPAGSYSPVEYSAIIYGRAPLFILELQKEMGEVAINEFLREYVNVYRWQTVNSAQFKTLAEQRCACDLTAQFEEWVDGTDTLR